MLLYVFLLYGFLLFCLLDINFQNLSSHHVSQKFKTGQRHHFVPVFFQTSIDDWRKMKSKWTYNRYPVHYQK